MTLQATGLGLVFPGSIMANPLIAWQGTAGGLAFGNYATMDAATEKAAFIGHVYWEGSPTAAKTFSTSSKIHFRTGATTFADAGTTVRIGLQDCQSTTVLTPTPDGTFDSYVDVVGNGGVITSSDDNVVKSVTMSTGSKSITHGDLVAVVFDMTARAGTDSLALTGIDASTYGSIPGTLTYTASAWQTASSLKRCPCVLLEADDGTLGVLRGSPYVSAVSAYAFQASSSPDEYGLLFQVPFSCKVDGVVVSIGGVSAAADGALRLYSDPLGTPTQMASLTLLGEHRQGGSDDRPNYLMFGAQYELRPNTDYCISVLATGTANIDIGYATLASATHRGVQGLANCRRGSRSNETGAFSETTTEIPNIGLLISALDDGNGFGRTVLSIGI